MLPQSFVRWRPASRASGDVGVAQSRIEFANTLRGIAAISVLLSHYFGVFWLQHPTAAVLVNGDPIPADELMAPRYVIWINTLPQINWGAYGVALFFIISGFVIPFSLTRTTRSGFVVNRFFRLAPTYAAGFTVTLGALALSSRHFDNPWPYSPMQIAVHYVPGIRDLLWFPNIDGIIWTLEVEVKFYFVCWLLLPGFKRSSRLVLGVPFLLVVMGLLASRLLIAGDPAQGPVFIGLYNISLSTPMLTFMFIGVVFHYMYREHVTVRVGWAAIIVFFALFLLQFKSSVVGTQFPTSWSYGLAVLTFSCAYLWPHRLGSNPVSDFFASISYPLYVVHGIMGYAILLASSWAGLRPIWALLTATATAVVVALVLHTVVELPAQRLGRSLAGRLASTEARNPSHTLTPPVA